MAAGLAAALLILGLLAANTGFHQALHHGGKATDTCVLCLFANGHVDLPDTGPMVTTSIRSSFTWAPQLESVALADFTYLSSRSRAPPALASILSVVA